MDRLGAGSLGPYGNTWVPTPNFNALAARSTLFDNCLTDSPDLSRSYRGCWSGAHGLQQGVSDGTALQAMAGAGVRLSLVTDEPLVAQMPASDVFDEKLLLDLEAPTTGAAEIEQTALASLFAEAVDALGRQESPFLLWIHARGMAAPWDAPLALRQVLADEDDPDPLEEVAVPSCYLEEKFDPDDLLGMTQAYAAQVMVLDECLGVLAAAIEQCPQRQELVTVVTSPRGFPMGEHRIVGDFQTALYGELLHVPLLLCRGDGSGALQRSHLLTQTPVVAATLLDWFGAKGPTGFAQSLLPLATPEGALSECSTARDHIVSTAAGQIAIRTPAWFLRKTEADESMLTEHIELYRKPDDRWELNDVSRRCPHIVEQLTIAMDDYGRALRNNEFERIAPLAEELIVGLD